MCLDFRREDTGTGKNLPLKQPGSILFVLDLNSMLMVLSSKMVRLGLVWSFATEMASQFSWCVDIFSIVRIH